MNLKPNILIAILRKAVCIIFILFISTNFSFGSALSKDCKGGPDCANCALLAGPHAHGPDAGMQNNRCQADEKTGTCGFEAGQGPDDASRIALTVRSDQREFSAIFVAQSVVYKRPDFSGEFLLQFDSPDIAGAIPIYLLNDSLLC
jgi:hypothetical protein